MRKRFSFFRIPTEILLMSHWNCIVINKRRVLIRILQFLHPELT